MDPNSELPQLGSGRPERYEIDDQTATSPPHYTLLKAFDASHIFNKHPHKYDRLVAQEDGFSQDDSALSDEAEMSRYRSSFEGINTQTRQRSNSMSSLDTIAIESAMESLGSPQTIAPDLDDSTSKKMVASTCSSSNRADNMYRRCSLDHMADYYSRRTSDAAVSAIWDPTSQDTRPSSGKTTVKSAVTSYKQDQKKVEVFGDRHLAEIMMKAAFQDTKKSPIKEEPETREKKAKSEQPEGQRFDDGRRSSMPADLNKDEQPEVRKTSFGEEGETAPKVTTVQPKPRRLFGIGPLYHPLPETVIEGVGKTSLVDRIKKEGLGTGKDKAVKAAPAKKSAPTKPEVNTWAPFSM